MRLLSLPDEVLDLALKNLLPSFSSLADTHVFTVPTDLFIVRLVSRRLYRIATPLALRRTQLLIVSPAAMDFNLAAREQASTRFIMRCRFFHEHPELAAHVRILIVDIGGHASPDVAWVALREAMKGMSSLRTVLVSATPFITFSDIRQILQKPLFPAICLFSDFPMFPAKRNLGTGLKILPMVNSVCPATFVAAVSTSFECVSIELAHSRNRPATLREMPWTTLKEVALVGYIMNFEWSAFLSGFELYRNLGIHTALTELVIGLLEGLSPARVNELLDTFSEQPLTRLILYHVNVIDPQTVSRVVKAFPVLRHLTLLTEGKLAPWPGALDTYAQEIAGFPLLESFAWNNFYLEPALETAFSLLSNDTLGTLYARHVHALVRHVQHLRYVKFTSVTDRVVDTVDVRWTNARNRSRSNSPVEVRRVTEVALHTSSWSTISEAFRDI